MMSCREPDLQAVKHCRLRLPSHVQAVTTRGSVLRAPDSMFGDLVGLGRGGQSTNRGFRPQLGFPLTARLPPVAGQQYGSARALRAKPHALRQS
jgi:hypothetical protein